MSKLHFEPNASHDGVVVQGEMLDGETGLKGKIVNTQAGWRFKAYRSPNLTADELREIAERVEDFNEKEDD